MTLVQRIEGQGCGCDAPEHAGALIGIDAALRRIAAHARPVPGTETVALAEAQGRILAKPVMSGIPVPPFDNAAMDGYAVDTSALAGSGPWRLELADRVPAGQMPGAGMSPGTAARIFTGAPVPAGADAVVVQEEVLHADGAIHLHRRPPAGLNIRRAGDDMAPGAAILGEGRRLGPREIAAAAAAGYGRVRVRRRLRVALLVTGDEVRQAGSGRQDAQIWDVNTPMLGAALDRPSVETVAIRRAPDRPDELLELLGAMAADADLVVTTGGISVGEEDHVKPALGALGAEIVFSGVALKPGKPVSFGRLGPAFWLGLPGNPLSAFVTWQVFGTATLRALSGQTGGRMPRRHAVTAEPIRRQAGRCELRPARVAGFDGRGREVLEFEAATHSGRVARLPDADGLMYLPADATALPAGALVEFQPFCDIC